MPTDLPSLFDRLRRETVTDFLASPDDLRRVADRRQRARRAVLAGLAAAAVVVIAATAATVLPDRLSHAPVPPATRTPTVAPSSPEPTATGSPLLPVPDAAFLTAADTLTGGAVGQSFPDPVLPDLCGAVLTQPDEVVATRVVWSDYRLAPDLYFTEGVTYTQITIFAGDAAQRYMEAVRSAVAACGGEDDGRGNQVRYSERVVALPGDETYTFVAAGRFEIFDDFFVDREDPYYLVRLGDAVLVLAIRGWEGSVPDEQRARQIRDSAIQRFLEWGGGRA